jgi:hypothetical protein
LNDPERDPVVVKLAQIMSQMKEGKEVFIVARLHPQEYADKWAQVRKQEIANEALNVTTESEVASRNAQLQAEALDSAGIASSLPTRSQVQNFDAAQQQKEGSVSAAAVEEDDFAQKALAIESSGNDDGLIADKMETENDDANDDGDDNGDNYDADYDANQSCCRLNDVSCRGLAMPMMTMTKSPMVTMTTMMMPTTMLMMPMTTMMPMTPTMAMTMMPIDDADQ